MDNNIKQPNIPNKTIVLALGILVLISIGVWMWNAKTNNKGDNKANNIVENVEDKIQKPEDLGVQLLNRRDGEIRWWKMYTNEKYGYKFKQVNMIVDEINPSHIQLFDRDSMEQTASFFMEHGKNLDDHFLHNPYYDEIKKQSPIENIAETPEDPQVVKITVAGRDAYMYKSLFQDDPIQYAYYIRLMTDNNDLLTISLLSSEGIPIVNSLELFQVERSKTPLDTSGWTIYKNANYKFYLRYPENWLLYEKINSIEAPFLSLQDKNSGGLFSITYKESIEIETREDNRCYSDEILKIWINKQRDPNKDRIISLKNTLGYGWLEYFDFITKINFSNCSGKIFEIWWSSAEKEDQQAYNEFKTIIKTIEVYP